MIDRTRSEVEKHITKVAGRRAMSGIDFWIMRHNPGFNAGPLEGCNRLREFAAVGVNGFFFGFAGHLAISPLELIRDAVGPGLR